MCSEFADSHSPADLLKDNDTSEVVDTADDSGSFHILIPPLFENNSISACDGIVCLFRGIIHVISTKFMLGGINCKIVSGKKRFDIIFVQNA